MVEKFKEGIMGQWIVPCNPNLYDVYSAFKNLSHIDWKQTNSSISVGDEVFIYVAEPISSILYRCRVIKANLSEPQIDDSAFILNDEIYRNRGNYNYMELELLEKYNSLRFHIDVLRENVLKRQKNCLPN